MTERMSWCVTFEGGHLDGHVHVMPALPAWIDVPVPPKLSFAAVDDTAPLPLNRVRYRRTERLSRYADYVYELEP